MPFLALHGLCCPCLANTGHPQIVFWLYVNEEARLSWLKTQTIKYIAVHPVWL